MTTPKYVADLEASYGVPSQQGFGSSVFYQTLRAEENLESVALTKYQYFLGGKWSDAYQAAWARIYTRLSDASRNIEAELRSIGDANARSSASMILDDVESAATAKQALSAAYDDPDVTELNVHSIGDGEAMSGLVVSGRRSSGESTFLVFLMD